MKAFTAVLAAALSLTFAAPSNADDGDSGGYDSVYDDSYYDDDSDNSYGSSFDGDNTTQQICLELNEGRSLGGIAHDLNAGDGRWNSPNATLRVWNTVVLQGSCG